MVLSPLTPGRKHRGATVSESTPKKSAKKKRASLGGALSFFSHGSPVPPLPIDKENITSNTSTNVPRDPISPLQKQLSLASISVSPPAPKPPKTPLSVRELNASSTPSTAKQEGMIALYLI
jgi:hypothetical protein